jgi:hypothetical protein
MPAWYAALQLQDRKVGDFVAASMMMQCGVVVNEAARKVNKGKVNSRR